ncbi:MAG: type IX secretion system outer membrane channel protein PorV [Crocinitomicaceae bacterium]|nr:type IX secretion system outer membrane channel protein PorV [Crocinitomicaceae bacterium]
MIKKFSLLLVVASPLIAIAQPNSGASNKDLQLNAITTAMPFLSITPDSRAGAMGDAGTALSANSNSVYWNTAMLNFSKQDAEVSVSYTPWLRQLTNDMSLSYVSGYKRIGKRHAVTGGLRFFSLGEITFTDSQGGKLRDDNPSEYEIVGGYAFKLADKLSIGINGKFAYSNLTGGYVTPGGTSKAGVAAATDISFVYYNDEAKLSQRDGIYTFGLTLNNIGNKVAYSEISTDQRDFLPMNLKIGNAYTMEFDKFNTLTWAVDVQKLLVPTPPARNPITGDIYSGKNNNVGVISGMLQSFYDAPGTVVKDDQGAVIQNADGTYKVEKGSRLKEELREFNIGTGLEYWYNEMFALRAGFFYEHYTKGSRQYFNAGVGLKYKVIGIDISYLAGLRPGNPLANTVRFTLRFEIPKNAKSNAPSDAE